MFSIVTEGEITIHTVYNNDKCHVCTLRAPHARHSNMQFVPLQVTERTHTSHQLMSKTLTNLNFQNPRWRTRPQNHKLLGRSKYYLTCSLPLDASCLVGFLHTSSASSTTNNKKSVWKSTSPGGPKMILYLLIPNCLLHYTPQFCWSSCRRTTHLGLNEAEILRADTLPVANQCNTYISELESCTGTKIMPILTLLLQSCSNYLASHPGKPCPHPPLSSPSPQSRSFVSALRHQYPDNRNKWHHDKKSGYFIAKTTTSTYQFSRIRLDIQRK